MSVTPKVWGRVHVVGDFVVQAYLKGDTSGPGGVARRYVGEIGAKVDSLIVIGRGEVEIILYDYVSEACESLQIRASKFAQCETLEIVSWTTIGAICAPGIATWRRGAREHKYQQSRACDGCEVPGLPVCRCTKASSQLCSDLRGWETFCVSYLNAEDVEVRALVWSAIVTGTRWVLARGRAT